VLDNMTSDSTGPWDPQWLGSFAQGRDGNLYGTSQNGGTLGHGVVFQLAPSGTLTVIHSFDGAAGGSVPHSGLMLGADGLLYGTTCNGGSANNGTLFKITTAGTFTVVHNFSLANNEGYCPDAPPVQGPDGNFYGTTTEAPGGVGSVYKVTPAGVLTTLHTFDAPNGETPLAIVLGTDGLFYGTTRYGGPANRGTVFKITATGTFTLLHSFTSTDGNDPIGPIVQAADGDFYGGTDNAKQIYKITPTGVFSIISTLDAATGEDPVSGLIQATDGNLYGTTSILGANGGGTILQLTTGGTATVEYNFALATGSTSQVSLFQHTNGSFYSDTSSGGSSTKAGGVFYKLDTGLGPFVAFVPSQISAVVGKTIGILGQGFTGTTKVAFSGTPATFNVVSDTFLTATVPAGAKTGKVSVTIPGGVRSSNQIFRVRPQLTTFNPTSGPVGTVVTITGVSLTQTKAVTFGGVKSTGVVIVSDTQITASVPTGAKSAKIAVTTPGGSASSTATFTVTQ
jgi:uncharacterized repeat protein (TIGR03803 family)